MCRQQYNSIIYIYIMLYTIKFTFKRGIVSCMKNVEGFLLNTDLFIETGQDYWSLFSANENEIFLPLTRNELKLICHSADEAFLSF